MIMVSMLKAAVEVDMLISPKSFISYVERLVISPCGVITNLTLPSWDTEKHMSVAIIVWLMLLILQFFVLL